MKNIIIIDQRFIRKHGLTFTQAIIFDGIRFALNRARKEKKKLDNEWYYSCSRLLVSKLLPEVCDDDGLINRSTWNKCLKKLVEVKLIKLHPDNQRTRATFIALGELAKSYAPEVWTLGRRKTKEADNDELLLEANQRANKYTQKPKKGDECVCEYPLNEDTNTHSVGTDMHTSNIDILDIDKRHREKNNKKRNAFDEDDARQQLVSMNDPSLLEYFDATRELWAEWLEYRRSMRKPYASAKTFALAIRSAYKQNPDATELRRAIDASVASGWQGLFLKCPKKACEKTLSSAPAPAAPVRASSLGRAICESNFSQLSREEIRIKNDPAAMRRLIESMLTP
jgi:hypothetical protein